MQVTINHTHIYLCVFPRHLTQQPRRAGWRCTVRIVALILSPCRAWSIYHILSLRPAADGFEHLWHDSLHAVGRGVRGRGGEFTIAAVRFGDCLNTYMWVRVSECACATHIITRQCTIIQSRHSHCIHTPFTPLSHITHTSLTHHSHTIHTPLTHHSHTIHTSLAHHSHHSQLINLIKIGPLAGVGQPAGLHQREHHLRTGEGTQWDDGYGWNQHNPTDQSNGTCPANPIQRIRATVLVQPTPSNGSREEEEHMQSYK